MTVQAFQEDAQHEFYRWLNSLSKEAVAQLSKTELAELAYREATKVQFKRAVEMTRVLAHPDLHILAGALASETAVTA